MIPKGSEGIAHLVGRMMSDLVPRATDAYTMSDLAMTATLIGMVAEDYERAADVLVADEADMLEIFRAADKTIGDEGLRNRMRAAFSSPAESLRISVLSARADAAMKILIELHAAVEAARDAGESGTDALDGLIWSFLERHTERRAYHAAF